MSEQKSKIKDDFFDVAENNEPIEYYKVERLKCDKDLRYEKAVEVWEDWINYFHGQAEKYRAKYEEMLTKYEKLYSLWESADLKADCLESDLKDLRAKMASDLMPLYLTPQES